MKSGTNFSSCALCDLRASLFCPADEAFLCLRCDAKVHGANFLVARHCRVLLCSSCEALTDIVRTGWGVDPGGQVCQRCFVRSDRGDEGSSAEGASSTQSRSLSSSQLFEKFGRSQHERGRRRPSEVVQGQESSTKCPSALQGSRCDEPVMRESYGQREHVKSVGSVDDSGSGSCKASTRQNLADESSCESNVLQRSPLQSITRKRSRRTSAEEQKDTEDTGSSSCSSQDQSSCSSQEQSVWHRRKNPFGVRSLKRAAD